jgi:hypothetical protein
VFHLLERIIGAKASKALWIATSSRLLLEACDIVRVHAPHLLIVSCCVWIEDIEDSVAPHPVGAASVVIITCGRGVFFSELDNWI